jgi:hypothetical protein
MHEFEMLEEIRAQKEVERTAAELRATVDGLVRAITADGSRALSVICGLSALTNQEGEDYSEMLADVTADIIEMFDEYQSISRWGTCGAWHVAQDDVKKGSN